MFIIYYYTLNNYAHCSNSALITPLWSLTGLKLSLAYLTEFHYVTLLITPLIVAEILSRHILCNITSHTTSKSHLLLLLLLLLYIKILCSCIFDQITLRLHYRLLFVSTLSSHSIQN